MSNPINYRDASFQKYRSKLEEKIEEYETFKLGGAHTMAIMGLYHLNALRQQNSFELDHADRLLMMPDLFHYYLTGSKVNEYTNATMMVMVNQNKKIWEDRLFAAVGARRELCGDPYMPGTLIGNIQRSVCEELEIPPIPVVGVATHDTASAIAGVPLSGAGKSWSFLSLGTWAITGIETDRVHTDMDTFKSGFANQGGCEGKTNFVNLYTGLWVIQQCYERWSFENDKLTWDDITKATQSAKSGKTFIDLDSPEFALPNPNMPKAVQDYCTARGYAVPQDMGEIAACVYESLVLKIKKSFMDAKRLSNKDISLIHVFGGGVKNKLLCQWIADATGLEVKAGPAETTSVGNLLLQMKGTGEIKNLAQGREISSASFDIKEYHPSNAGLWNEYYNTYTKVPKI